MILIKTAPFIFTHSLSWFPLGKTKKHLNSAVTYSHRKKHKSVREGGRVRERILIISTMMLSITIFSCCNFFLFCFFQSTSLLLCDTLDNFKSLVTAVKCVTLILSYSLYDSLIYSHSTHIQLSLRHMTMMCLV